MRRLVRCVAALSLLPAKAIDTIWSLLCARAPIEIHGITNFIAYIDQTWIATGSVLFPKNVLNHFENSGPRTRNHLEGFHHKINKRIGIADPNVYELILVLKDIQQENELTQEQIVRGRQATIQRRRYREANEILGQLKIALLADEMTVLDYLDACSFQIKL